MALLEKGGVSSMLHSILLDATVTEVSELSWRSPIPTWLWFLLIIPLAAVFAAWIYRRELRPEGGDERGWDGRRKQRWVLSALRTLLLLAAVGILCEPVLRKTKYRDIDPTVLVLVDDSLSMDIADKYSDRERVQKLADFLRSSPENIESTKRYDLIRRLFRDEEIGFLEKLSEKGKVSLFTFAGTTRRVAEVPRKKAGEPRLEAAKLEVLPDYEELRTQERVRETRISDALLDALAAERTSGGAVRDGGRISSIILFTDGQQTPGARSIDDVARRLGQQRIPVHTVGLGNPDEPKDIRVLHLDVNDIVLAGDIVPFDAAIVSHGYQGERVRVDLELENVVVATQYITLEGGGARQAVRLEYRPPNPGDFLATVRVEHREGELFVENNAASKPLKVLDQKIRVLYAEGPPRWEYRYLKNALIRDPTMQAQVFLFSADPTFVQESSEGVPPLAEFPRTREAIFSYHVIILGDVDIERHLSPEQISILKEFVYEAGGGLVFIAGETANPHGYLHTDLNGLVPVEVSEKEGLAGGLEMPPKSRPFNVELTQVGKEHTLMRLDNDFERNAQLWENKDGRIQDHLPGFLSFQEAGRPKKGAVVLARHPSKVHPIEQKGLVVLAFMNYGKGRTFFSAVDDTWRWRAGVDNQYFYRFWGQVIRFSATGRLLGKTPRFSITTDKQVYTIGETVSLECRVFDANMKPSTEDRLTAYHQAQAGELRSVESMDLQLDPIQGQGTYHGGLVANRLGLHDVWIGTETERSAFRTFDVVVPALELRDPRRNRLLLEKLAADSGGKYHELEAVPALVQRLEGVIQSRQGEIEEDPLWDDWWLVLAFTGLIAIEWVLRKVVHLL